MNGLVPQRDIDFKDPILPLQIVANFTIVGVLIFIALADVVTWIYQEIFFSIHRIPKIPRSRYVQMKRHKLEKLNIIQKWSCGYCEYTNGVIAWTKAVANQTEVYCCAIKYTHHYPGQEYQENFYEPAEFRQN